MTDGWANPGRRSALRRLAGAMLAGVLLAGCGKWSMPKLHMPNWLWWRRPPAELPLVDELAITSGSPNAAGERFEQRRDYETLAIDVYSAGEGSISITRRDPDRPWPFHLVFRFHLSSVAVLDLYGDQHLHMSPGTPNVDGLVVVMVPVHVYSSRTRELRVAWSASGSPPPTDSAAMPETDKP
jgi:hypothetical protein